MAIQGEAVAHTDLVGGGQTPLHSHAGGGGGPTVKSGTATTSGGSATVTFTTPFPDTNYAIAMSAAMGADAIIANWSGKTASGFDISTQNDKGVDVGAEVLWVAVSYSDP